MEKKVFDVGGRALVWETDPKRFVDNNLYIEGLWNMRDTVGHDDCCVGVRLMDGGEFCFTVFNGLSFTMRVTDGGVEVMEKRVTK